MRGKGARAAASAVLIGLVAAGCTSQEPGNPGAADGNTATTTTTSSAAPTGKPRPREIKLDGLDPCKALTAEQMQELGLAEAERNDSDLVKTGEVPVCDYGNNSSPRITYGVGLVTNKGIDHWRDGGGNVDVEEIEIGGYSAVQLTLEGTSTLDCSVAVDVADEQQLYVDFSPVGDEPSQEQMCDNAKKAAELALVTLPTLT